MFAVGAEDCTMSALGSPSSLSSPSSGAPSFVTPAAAISVARYRYRICFGGG